MAAGNSIIGALRVVLGADTAALDKGLKGAQKSLGNFQANMGKVGAAIGVAMGAAIVGIGVAVKNSINEADKLGKMAQSIGIPVEELSRLKHAADLSGVSLESLGKATIRLSRNMSESIGEPTSTAARAFKTLGISVANADGTLKSSSEVMTEVAGRFEKMQDGAGKTALAVQLFGRSGAELIPMLNAGKAGLSEMMKEADALGIVIDNRTAKAAEAFNDNLTRLGRVVTGITTKIAAALSPALMVLTGNLVEFAKENNLAKVAAEKILSTFDFFARAAAVTAHFFTGLARETKALWDVLTAFVSKSPKEFAEAWERFRQEEERSAQGLKDITTRFQDFNEQARMVADHMGNLATVAGARTAPALIGTKNALDGFIASTQKSIAAQKADAMAVGLSAGARERLKIVMQAEAITLANNIVPTDALRIKITELANKSQAAAIAMERQQVVLANLTPMQAYQLEVERLNKLFAEGERGGETYGRAMAAAADKAGFSWKQQVPSIAGSFAEIANTFGKENKRIAAAAQVFSAFQALVSTYAGSAEALKLPFPLNLAASAAVLAKGLALVAAIKGFAAPKMATGGALRMPNMSRGSDSQLLQARVQPGEQVDIWRPGEGGDDPRRGAGTATVLVPLQGYLFNRDTIAAWIDGVNDAARDGYRLKIA